MHRRHERAARNGAVRGARPGHQSGGPEGERLDFRERNYFPAAPGDTWTYEVQGSDSPFELTRTVSEGLGGDVIVTERGVLGRLGQTTTLRRTPDGIVEVLVLGRENFLLKPPTYGNLLKYAEPFYAIGSTRQIVRQGARGVDSDRDGIDDTRRIEFSQTLVGFETLDLPIGTLHDVVHFRNVLLDVTLASASDRPAITTTKIEEEWWAPGIGLVRAERAHVVERRDAPATTDAYTMVVTGGTVDGVPLMSGPGETADGTVIAVALPHVDLAYDASRRRYYASVPGDVPVNGNRIAVIDAITGTVTYPGAAVGSEPGPMELTADGAALYVGLSGSGDVVKLQLPDFVELWRARLPATRYPGQLVATDIAVSPIDPDVIAVAMSSADTSPQGHGVALVRAGVLQPPANEDQTRSMLVAFDGSGAHVYGLSDDTSERRLRRLAVLSDGLAEESGVSTNGGRTLDWTPNGLILDRAVHRTPDLSPAGTINVQGGGCRPHSVPNRLVCAYNAPGTPESALAVVDATSFVILSTATYQRNNPFRRTWKIVPGAPGQVAMSVDTKGAGVLDAVWLFDAPALK